MPRCEWLNGNGQQCRRPGRPGIGLCAQHEAMAEEGEENTLDEFLGHPTVQGLFDHLRTAIDRVAGVLDRRIKEGPAPRQPMAGGPPPPPRPGPQRLTAAACRALLHFGPNEPLTPEKVKTRRRQLVPLVHPDAKGAHEAMVAINQATDFLLATLR